MLENLRLIECHPGPQGANGSGGRVREMNRMNSEIEEVNDGNILLPVVMEARIRVELPRQPEGTTMVAEILGKPYWKKNTKLNIME